MSFKPTLLLLAATAVLLTQAVQAAPKPCDELKAEIAARLIQQILAQRDSADHHLYNINIPTSAFARPTEVRVVPMATVGWAAEFDRRVDPKGRRYYWATGVAPVPTSGEMTDLEAWQKGYVTLTPLRIDRTETAMLERMYNWNLSLESSDSRWK